MNQKRQPRGIPTGGEFAHNEHDEAAALSGDDSVDYTAKPSAIVGDAKVVLTYGSTDYSEPSWRAHVLVEHNKLPFNHPLHNSQDEDGFIEIGSAPTDEDASTADLGGVALLRATELEKELQEVGSSHADTVATRFVRDLTGSKADDSEVIRRAVNPEAVAEDVLKRLVDEAKEPVDREKALAALQEAAQRGIDDERRIGFADTNDLSKRVIEEHYPDLGAYGSEDLKYRAAIITAVNEGAGRVETRRNAVATASATKRLAGTGLENDPAAISLVSSAARTGYTQGWSHEGMDDYPTMAEAGMRDDPYRAEYLTWTREKQELLRASALLTAMDGHTASYDERFER